MRASGIPLFDYAIDFGWFWFLTKPIFLILLVLRTAARQFRLAILLLTLCVKLLFFPLANKSYQAMSKMKLLQPEIQKLRERFPDDKARQQQEMMALYKRVGANPLAGCLPIVIQIPVFFSLYKVLFVTIEMRHAPFFGWIHDLSAPDPTSFANLFGLLPFTPARYRFLMIGAWPLIMGVTMFLQQKLNPQPVDPMQARMFMMLPVVFTYMLSHFPAGLVIYWAWNNTLSIAQQWVIMRRAGRGLSAAAATMARDDPADLFPPRAIDPELVEAGRRLFAREARFVAGAAEPAALPPETLPEIAFAGRSNVGKSSLVNALTGRRVLARTSNTPGPHAADQFLRSRRRADAGRPAGLRLCRGVEERDQALDRAGAPLSAEPRGLAPGLPADRLPPRHQGARPTACCDMLDRAGVSYQIVLTKTDKLGTGGACRDRRTGGSRTRHPHRRASGNPADQRRGAPRHRRVARDARRLCRRPDQTRPRWRHPNQDHRVRQR